MRLGLLALGLISLTACYDFAGELDKIGFDSNLVVDGGKSWTPDHPIANTSRAVFEAVEIVGDKEDRKPEVTGAVSGDASLRFVDERSLGVTGSDGRARVRFDGELTDHFKILFRAPVAAELVDVHAVAHRARETALPEAFGMLEGTTREVGVSLTDRRGRSLGYVQEDLVLGGDSGVSAWREEGEYRLVAEGAGVSTISVGYGDHWFDTSRVYTVSPEDIGALVVHHVVVDAPMEDDTLIQVAVWAEGRTHDGLPVLGIPVDWSWTDIVDADVGVYGDTLRVLAKELPSDSIASARWGDLMATVRLDD